MVWYWLFLAIVVLGAAAAHAAGVVRFGQEHPKAAWVAAGLVLFTGSWMCFDGARAFVVGDYMTPGGSGRLGPWSGLVAALGVDPRSGAMKAVFVLLGAASITAALAYLSGAGWGRRAILAVTCLGLWYLPFGTLLGGIALVLLLLPRGADRPNS